VAPDYPSRTALDVGILREVVAALLLLACVVGVSWAAFATDWRLGLAVVSLAAGGVGLYLANER